MDINYYLAQQYGPQPCWELVSHVITHETGYSPLTFRTVNSSIREIASEFRIALSKASHGFMQVNAPVNMCVVLMGKSERVGIHHCGICFDGAVLHAMPGINLYEPLSVIKDKFEIVQFWAKP